MCTVVLSLRPGQPVLLAGIRDELTDRAWRPPGRHWPGYPDLTGGIDLQAGGTWLAVHAGARRVASVLNGIGQAAPAGIRRSRGELPLKGAAGLTLDRAGLAGLDPFRLVVAEPSGALLSCWDGAELAEHTLGPGLHMIVNSALASQPADASAADPVAIDQVPGSAPPDGRAHERARLARFLTKFAAAEPPQPRPGASVTEAWRGWYPLVNGDGLSPQDPAALIVRRDLGDGRIWGSTSVSLVAIWPGGVRYDFCGRPGDPAAWVPVL